MLRNAVIFLVSCVALLGLFVWSENEVAHTFQSCVSEQSPKNSTERANNQGYRTSSLGMGLSICHSIIEAHGGRIWAGANEPRGAAFHFTLPLKQDKAVPPEHAGPMPAL
jgi:hypothetical protein